MHILLILTDGEVHDLDETTREIQDMVEQDIPIYIVIVGIGEESFANMVKLDGDDIKIANKDIVHFVRYNTVASQIPPNNKISEQDDK
mmetsp:Transcript_36488/g.26564  ORF Transcript_36488/g.26564 Transcript_36488/m.26564 type:complete len:88 (-) Transcript_36488:172-435(-)